MGLTTLVDTDTEQQTVVNYVRVGGDGYDSDASQEHYEFQSPEQIAESRRAYNVTKAGLLHYARNMAMVPTEPVKPWWIKSDAQPQPEDPDEYHSACSSFDDEGDSSGSKHTMNNGAAPVALLSTTFIPLAFDTFSRQEWMARREELRQLQLSDQRLMDVRHMFAQVTKRHERQLHKQFLHDFAHSQAPFELQEMFSAGNTQVLHNQTGSMTVIVPTSTQSIHQPATFPTLTDTLLRIIFLPRQDNMLRLSVLTEGNGSGRVPTLHVATGLADFIDNSRQYGINLRERRYFVDLVKSLMDMQHLILLAQQQALIHMHTAAAMQQSLHRLQNNVTQQYIAMREAMMNDVPVQEVMPLFAVLPAYPCDAVDTAARVQASLDITDRLAHSLQYEQPFNVAFPHYGFPPPASAYPQQHPHNWEANYSREQPRGSGRLSQPIPYARRSGRGGVVRTNPTTPVQSSTAGSCAATAQHTRTTPTTSSSSPRRHVNHSSNQRDSG